MASCIRSIVLVAVIYSVLVVGQDSKDEIDIDDLVAGIINMAETTARPTTTTASSSGGTTTAIKRATCPMETSLCVPYHLCSDGAFNETEVDLNDPTSACHYLTTCCVLSDIHEERITEEPPTNSNTSPPSNTATPVSVIPASATSTPTRPVTIKPPVAGAIRKCGIRNKDGLTYRITNALDSEAEYAEFPWMMAIFEQTEVLGVPSNVFKCGGSLIHPRVVLTAAHCVQKKNVALLARAGEWDTQTEFEVIPHQDRKVVEVVAHEGFHKGGLFNDIALLVLEKPIESADNIGYACLPKAGTTFDSIQCTASGWGAHELGGVEQTILKKIDLPVVPRAACQEVFRKLRNTPQYELHESYLCAGGTQGKDTCKGDGGSPLVCPTMLTVDQYVQAGIVSWGRGCGSAQVPGVYADVATLRDWIDLKMTERNLDTFYYEV